LPTQLVLTALPLQGLEPLQVLRVPVLARQPLQA
jgi:hypothetical protein